MYSATGVQVGELDGLLDLVEEVGLGRLGNEGGEQDQQKTGAPASGSGYVAGTEWLEGHEEREDRSRPKWLKLF